MRKIATAIFCLFMLPGAIYFYTPHPFMLPLLFLYTATLIALYTPMASPYKLINFILVAEFLLAIGIDTLIWNNTSLMADPVMFDLYKATFNSIFYLIFILAGGVFLASVALGMVLYHSARIFAYVFGAPLILEFSYEIAITLFCLLQLACVFRGMLHGIDYRFSISGHRSNHTRDGIA